MTNPRARKTPEQWAVLIEQQTQSGLSINEFCHQQDLALATFSKWKRRLNGSGAKQPDKRSAFEPVRVTEPSAAQAHTDTTIVTLSIGTVSLTIANHNPGA